MRSGQLLAAVAAAGAEHIAGEALRVDPAQHVFAVPDLALYQRHMVLAVEVVDVAVDLELTEPRRHFGAGLADHMLVVAAAVVLQRL